jgi:hypothetical protein
MTTDLGFLNDTTALPETIPGAVALEPGRLNWYHGVNAGNVKTPGVFYARATAFIENPPAPWVEDTRFADEPGYSAPELNIAFIANRSQWFIPAEEQGKPPQRWLQGYEAGAKKLTEYLVLVQGLSEPMVLSVSGKYKAGPFADILSEYRRGALAQAMRQVRRTLPAWAFWLPIAGKRDAQGKPIYLKASDGDGKEYGSIVTPAALAGRPIPASVDHIVQCGVIWQEYAEWRAFKRGQDAAIDAVYTVETPPALFLPRNVPQAIEDDELF